jgi:AcrR family transcriptional regulator
VGGTAKRPKDRRASIVDAAADLFGRHGFAAVGIDDIGAAVGVSGPAIYRHFAGKEAVLAAVLEASASRIAGAVAAVGPRPGDDDADPIEVVVRRAVAAALDDPAGLATYLRERHRLDDAPPAMVAAERRIRRAWLAALRAVHPGLQRADAELRQAAVVGALGAVAGRPPSVARPRLDELVTASAAAMLRTPAARSPGDADADGDGDGGARDTTWTPPPARRDEILGAALRLFRERGFHGVGIDEIGEAAGITGPTVYHHYRSKAEILVDAYDRAGQRVAVGVDDALASARSGDDALERLARSYVAVALDNVDLMVVTTGEGGALPEEEKPRMARRGRAVRDAWAGVIAELRPELTDAEARLVARMALPLVNRAAQVAGRRSRDPGPIAELAVAFCRAC